MIQNQVAQKWNTSQVDPQLSTAPRVILTFEIQRDGTVRDIRFLQRSGHPTLDYSAERAVMDASPLRALPRNFPKDSVRVEFHFELKR